MDGVAIVIPTWNQSSLLQQLLENLRRQTFPVQRVIIIDNGSSDDTAAVGARAGADVISLGKNAGFASAVNRGIREASGAEWICVLNNDVTLEADWLELTVRKLQESQAWFAAGKLLSSQAHEVMDGSFDAICRGGCAWRCGHGRLDAPVWNRSKNIQLPPFTATVFRAGLFERVGLLDERFESYLEDVDFGLRCAEAGLAGVYVPEAIGYHEGSATLGRWHANTVRMIARNQLLLVSKHYPPDWVSRYGWPVFVAQALWGLTALRHGAFLSYLTGKLEGIRRFREVRGKHCPTFPAIIEQSEKELRELQQTTGFDLFWRLYFALT